MLKHKTIKRLVATLLTVILAVGICIPASAVVLDKSFIFYNVPNAHIDTAWRWPYQHTAETVISATFGNMITRMNNNAAGMFSTSASKHYEWVEEYYYNATWYPAWRNYIANGRWDITGGQVVEPDLNVPSGEALARQGLYGQRFFADTYGKDKMPVTGFVPDVFGFAGQFPQILQKTGLRFFVTSKLNWNDTDYLASRREADIQWWEALDGSRVLAYILSIDYPTGAYSVAQIQNAFNRNWDAFPQTVETGVKRAMGFYGSGDHGGGPSNFNINTGNSSSINSTATQFFKDVEAYEDLSKVPVHQGEYYFEYHRGTYTSWSRMKRYNRTSEILADSAEKAATLSFWTGSVTSSSMNRISAAWDKILINQFHDVLPGSSAPYVYYVAFNEHEMARNLLNNVQNNALAGLAYRVNTSNIEGTPVFVYNSLSWERTDYATAVLSFDTLPAAVAIYDGATEIPSAIIARDAAAKTLTVSFKATVPALGYKVLSAVARDSYAYAGGVSYNPITNVAENENLRITFNPATGYIKSLIDKNTGREMVQQGIGTEGAELHIYKDTGGGLYPAWDLIKNEMNKEPSYIVNDLQSLKVLESTSERVVIRADYAWSGSLISQEYTLTTGAKRLDIKMGVDWRDYQRLLKVSFPIAADSLHATYETGYGATERPTMRTADIDQWPVQGSYLYGEARFEVSGHKWLDVTDDSGGFGLSILNDGKYGFDSLRRKAPNGDIYVRSRITVVRSPRSAEISYEAAKFPPAAHPVDLGYQEFTYSIYPHAGGWQDANTVQQGYELGQELVGLQTSKHAGDLPNNKSFISINKDNVHITTVKNPYDAPDARNTFIIRMYESSGRDTSGVSVKLPSNVISAKEVDMVEYDEFTYAPPKAVTVSGDTVSFNIKKYEILTLKVEVAPFVGSPAYTVDSYQYDLGSFYNLDGVSDDSARNNGNLDGAGVTVPKRNWPAQVDYQGVIFKPATTIENGENNYVEARGQVIPAPAGKANKVFLLGSAAGPNADRGDFVVNYTDGTSVSKNIKFAKWRSDLTSWNNVAKLDTRPYVYDSIGWVFTHFHNTTRDEMTCDNYLFVYSIDVDPAKTISNITLPDSRGIKIVAITGAYSEVEGYASVYGSSPDYTVDNVCAPPSNVQAATKLGIMEAAVTWDPSPTPDILAYRIYHGTTPTFTANSSSYCGESRGTRLTFNAPLTMTPRPRYYKVTAVNRYGVESVASDVSNGAVYHGLYNLSLSYVGTTFSSQNSNERAEMMCDDNFGTKWCTSNVRYGAGHATIHLVHPTDEPVEILGFEVAHAGVGENQIYNTRDWAISTSLQHNTTATGAATAAMHEFWPEWIGGSGTNLRINVNAPNVHVYYTGNSANYTYHPLEEPVKARYFRIYPTEATQALTGATTDTAVRIYEVRALGFPKDNENIMVVPSPDSMSAVDEGTPVSAYFNLINPSAEEKTYNVFVALYNHQNKMIAINSKTVVCEPGEPKGACVSVPAPSVLQNIGVKMVAFIWDENFVPVTEAKVLIEP